MIHIKKNSRLIILMALAGALVLLVLGYAIVTKKPANSDELTCTSPTYQSVKNDMSKDEITGLLGAPATKRVKDSLEQNFFFQGENEAKIKEGWVYNLSGSKNAEIYFDSSGRVNGKNCGQG